MKLQVLGKLADSAPDAPSLSINLNTWVCAILVVGAGRINRETLAELLWPQLDPAAARSALRQRLHRLKQSPLAGSLQLNEHALAWTGDSDLQAFRAACARQDWDAALRHYGGPLLLEVPFPPHQDFSEWLENERTQLQTEYLRVLWQAVQARDERGEQREVLALLRHAAELTPDAPEIVEELATRLLRLGERAEARLLISRFASRLRQEVGVDLPPALQLLHSQAAVAHAGASQGEGGQGAVLEPQPSPAVVRGLPSYLTTFVGRDAELGTALSLLSPHQTGRRWLTLTGPGGIGKTRLATELARWHAEATGQDVLFTALAPLGSGQQVAGALLQGLDQPLEGDTPAQQRLIRALAERSILLVLDNFEHLLDAAELVPALLAACPNVRVLVTSRERLNYQSETVLRLGGLDESSADAGHRVARHTESLGAAGEHHRSEQLFSERASRADASFDPTRWTAAVQRIARRCQGLPLALELAAASVGDASPDAISRQLEATWDVLHTTLRDLPERHRSLRAVFEYSWTALPTRLQRSYANLSVLRSAFGHAAAAQVADVTEADLRLLERRSLLTRSAAGLYGWHENLREYALEQLSERRLALQDRHLLHFTQTSELAASRLRGLSQVQALDELAAQYPDLRSALNHATDVGRVELGLRLAGALHWFWYVRGYHREGLEILNTLLQLAAREGGPPSAAHALALQAAGSLAMERGLPELATQRFAAALAHYQALGDVAGQAKVWHGRGLLSRDQGHYAQAQSELDSALLLWERCNDRHGYATTLNDLGILKAYTGDNAAARQYFQSSLELKREVGDVQGVAYALNNLSGVTDDLHEVMRLDHESLRIKQELGDVQGCMIGHTNCGGTALELGRSDEAARHLVQALGLIRQLGKLSLLPAVLIEVSKLAQHQDRPQVVRALVSAALASDGQQGVSLRTSQRSRLEELLAWAVSFERSANTFNSVARSAVGAAPSFAFQQAAPAPLSKALEDALLFLNTDEALSAD